MFGQNLHMLNAIRADIYGLLRFGRFRPWNDWNDFNEHVVHTYFSLHAYPSQLSPISARPGYKVMMLPLLVGRTRTKMFLQSNNCTKGSRAQAILQPILLRRTKDSTIEGKPILELPPKEIELVQLKFSEDERDVSACLKFCLASSI
jgi:SNF2-related domain